MPIRTNVCSKNSIFENLYFHCSMRTNVESPIKSLPQLIHYFLCIGIFKKVSNQSVKQVRKLFGLTHI